MKAIKILLKLVVAIVALVIVALLALPLWFGPVAKTAANSAVPGIVKTGFHLGHLYLNPYTARFELGDMQLENPQGYSEKYAAKLGNVTFDAETFSLLTDVIHIEEITVKDVFVSVVSGGENKVDNYVQIQYNVAGGKDKYEAAQAAKQSAGEAEAAQPQADKAEKPQAAEPEKPAKKVIIDKLHISGLKVQYGLLPISVPVAIELKDIGRDSGGATLLEAGQKIWEGIIKSAGVTGEQLQALGNLTGEAAKQATEAANKAVSQATEAATKAASQATEAVSKATEGATKAVGNVTGKATESVGKAASAVSDTAAGATKAAGDAVNKATEGATKALDSLKKLW